MDILLLIIVVFSFLFLLSIDFNELSFSFKLGRKKERRNIHVIPELSVAKIIYKDTSSSKVFRNDFYRIQSKPDFMYKKSDGKKIIVEYKSRKRGVYDSDIKQLLATVLACRQRHPEITTGYVLNGGNEFKRIEIPINNDELFALIEEEYYQVCLIEDNNRPRLSQEPRKCRSCGFNQSCDVSAA